MKYVCQIQVCVTVWYHSIWHVQWLKARWFRIKTIVLIWWTRGESNSCPKTSWYDLLRGQSVFIISHYAPPTDRQRIVRSAFVLDRFRRDRRCKFTTTMTLSPQSWSSAEERVARRLQHCQLKRPRAHQLGSHSNVIVVVYFLNWAVIGITQPATLIIPQNPRRNHYEPVYDA